MDLAVGDALQIGDCVMTVIDIDGDEVAFRIDYGASGPPAHELREAVILPKK
jgi:hypothetical protein